MRNALTPLSALLLAANLGCAGTHVRSGLAPGAVAPGYDERWEAAFLFGALPLREHDLGRLCPEGWAEIRLEADVFTGAVGVLTLFLYTPSRVTIVCAAPAAKAHSPPPLPSYRVPGR